jgi:hypothetical protein
VRYPYHCTQGLLSPASELGWGVQTPRAIHSHGIQKWTSCKLETDVRENIRASMSISNVTVCGH